MIKETHQEITYRLAKEISDFIKLGHTVYIRPEYDPEFRKPVMKMLAEKFGFKQETKDHLRKVDTEQPMPARV